MTRQRTIATCHEHAARQFAPWSREAEDAGMKAWRALDSFTSLSAAELRQERRSLDEMADMIRRAREAANV